MDILTAIDTRRSIRTFIDRKIEDEKIERLLKSAMVSPTARNTQSWEFIVVDKRKILEDMAEVIPHGKMLKQASHGILVCTNSERALNLEYGVIDASAATQNILLTAHGIGVGAVWLGVYPRSERIAGLKKMFNLPAHITPVAGIALGYSEIDGQEVERFDKSKIHYNSF